MAQMAQNDLRRRSVEVEKGRLLATMRANKEKHIAEYDAAVKGYREALNAKLTEAFSKARTELDRREGKLLKRVAELEEEDVTKQPEYVTLVDAQTIAMPVPRSHADEYTSAINIVEWDVRETLTLTYAEFECFVRDKWEWKSNFVETSKLYAASPA